MGFIEKYGPSIIWVMFLIENIWGLTGWLQTNPLAFPFNPSGQFIPWSEPFIIASTSLPFGVISCYSMLFLVKEDSPKLFTIAEFIYIVFLFIITIIMNLIPAEIFTFLILFYISMSFQFVFIAEVTDKNFKRESPFAPLVMSLIPFGLYFYSFYRFETSIFSINSVAFNQIQSLLLWVLFLFPVIYHIIKLFTGIMNKKRLKNVEETL